MSALGKIAFAQMLLGSSLPYKPVYGYKSKSTKPKRKKDKPLAKVTYYTDENGQIKRKKEWLEEK